MSRQKVTLTLDPDQLEELRSLVGARSLSATVDVAVAAQVAQLRHFRAIDEWLAELDEEHGPAPAETREWAERTVDAWADPTGSASRRAR